MDTGAEEVVVELRLLEGEIPHERFGGGRFIAADGMRMKEWLGGGRVCVVCYFLSLGGKAWSEDALHLHGGVFGFVLLYC